MAKPKHGPGSGVPGPAPKHGETVVKSSRLPKTLLDQYIRAAKKRGIPTNTLIVEALIKGAP